MKKRILKTVSITVGLLLLLSFTAFADTGPKPSVVIELVGLGDEPCYGTLLSQNITNGPNRAWEEGEEMHAYHEDDPDIWRKFVDYKDTDGYYFLQQFWYCNETSGFKWGYYPPDPFKVLLYFPESDTFAVSPVYERYAFDSYYTIDVSDMQLELNVTEALTEASSAPNTIPHTTTEEYTVKQHFTTTPESDKEITTFPTSETASTEPFTYRADGTTSVTHVLLTAEPSYNYKQEVISLLARMAITLLIELAVAVIFGLRRKDIFGFIVGVNVVTQLLLNLILFSVDINFGSMAFTFYYILLEIAVFALEAFLYTFFIKKKSIAYSTKKATVYALVANALSFAAGLALAHIIPGIF